MAGLIQDGGGNLQKKNTISFGSKPPLVGGPDPEVLSQISNVTRRVRIIEETVSNLRRKTGIDETNSLSEIKKLHVNVKTIFHEIDSIKKEQESFKEEMRKMIREFQTVAKKDDVAVLQKYIKLWEPVQFATLNQVERLIADAVSEVSSQPQSFQAPSFEAPIEPSPTEEVAVKEPTTLFDGAPDTQFDADVRVESVDEDAEAKEEEESMEPVDPYRVNTKSDEIFAPHDSHGTFSQYTGTPGGAAPIMPSNVTADSVDTTAEDEVAPTVSPEQKKQIAVLIETYEDIRNMLINEPDTFMARVETEPELSKLFRGVNIKELSEKLKPHYAD